MYRVLSCARTSATSCGIITCTISSSARASSFTRPRSKCTRSTRRTASTELREAQGIGYCNITKCCTKVCPEEIHITDNAIIPLKERVVDDYYDPLGWLWKKMRRRNERAPEPPLA